MRRRFTNTLAVMVWVSVAWIALELYVRVTDQYNENWRYEWIMNDFWYMLNFMFLAIIAFLFRPTSTSTRYAYSELEGGFPVGSNMGFGVAMGAYVDLL